MVEVVPKETDHLECLLSRRRDQLASDSPKLREPRLPPKSCPWFQLSLDSDIQSISCLDIAFKRYVYVSAYQE